MEEVFEQENNYLVGNILYEGIHETSRQVIRGYKVLDLDSRNLVGLLNQYKVALYPVCKQSMLKEMSA